MRKLDVLAVVAVLALPCSSAFAQSPGSSSGATAGGSSAAGGEAASSTTTGSSMNGSTIGNKGSTAGPSPNNSLRNGPAGNAIGQGGPTDPSNRVVPVPSPAPVER